MKPRSGPQDLGALHRINEAAGLLAIKPSYLRQLVRERRIAVVRPTPSRRSIRIPASEIQRLVQEGYTARRDGGRQ